MQGERLAITVADQGPGMSEDDLSRASERFFRAETARNTPGAGLGLSLVQAVMSLHGGALELRAGELQTGQPGLSATLLLPVVPAVSRKG